MRHCNLRLKSSEKNSKLAPLKMLRYRMPTFREVTFTNCTFRDCLIVGTEFSDCEFHTCSFENCNTYKFRLRNTYIDPSSFILAKTYHRSASNIGVELFQKLYDNAMDSHQTHFAAAADVARRRWRRHQWQYDLRRRNAPKAKTTWHIFINLIVDLTAKYGYGPLRFLCISGAIFALVAWLAQMFWSSMGVAKSGVAISTVTFIDSLYYSMLLMTTLGFSDLLPANTAGKLYAIFCALFGISWIALFTAILVKRVIR
jgi:hypothetical protein